MDQQDPGREPPGPPTYGVVTLLFTDMVDSTRLLERLGDEAAQEVVETHFGLLREAVARWGGREVKSLGDGLMVAYGDPVEALHSAVSMQRAVAEENRHNPDRAVLLRVGLHAGEPLRAPWLRSREEDFFGTAVVVAKRLCDEARGGQILASELVTALAGEPGGFRFRPLSRRLLLKGIEQPVAAVEVESVFTPEAVASAASTVVPPAIPVRGPALVDRVAELATLESELDRSTGGEFRCLLLLGDPGVGKTRLAAELLSRRRGDVIALSARGSPLGEPTGFGLWAEALDRYLRVLSAERVSQLCGGFVEDLASLLSSVAVVRGSAPEREPPRASLLEALLVLVGNLADVAPLLIVFDDVHCADASSWECLAYLAHNAGDAPIQVVATARPGEMATRSVATEVTLGLEQDGVLRRLELRPLDVAALRALAQAATGRTPGAALVDWLAKRSGGNPLFALALLQALIEEGADLDAPELRMVPEPLAEHMRARLRGLSPLPVSVIEILAVAGRPVRLADLAFLTERSREELSPVLQRLVRSRLVAEVERDRELTYEIAHPLIQETVYQTIGGARRRVLHRVMGRALLASRRLGEAASHFSRSAGVGDPEAVEALCEALGQAERREAYEEAVVILDALVQILPAGDDRWIRVADAMAPEADWAAYHGADLHGGTAIRAMRESRAALERTDDIRRRAAVTLRLGSLLAWGTHELEEAEQGCRDAAELFEQAGESAQMLLAVNELAAIHGLRGDLAAWQEGARRVVEDAEATGHPLVVMRAAGALGTAAWWQGRFTDAEAAFRRCIAVAQTEGNLRRLAWALSSLAMTLAGEGRAAEATDLLERAVTLTPARRDSSLLEHETSIHWLLGAFPAALASSRAAAVLAPTASRAGAMGLAVGAVAAIETGQVAEAGREVSRCWSACGERPWFFYAAACAMANGLLDWREGRLEEALASMQGAVSGLASWRALPTLAFALVELVEVAAELGDVEAAGGGVAQLEAAADEIDRDLYRALAAIGRAWWRLAAGLDDAAAEAARRAVALLSDAGYHAFLARALDLLGRALAATDPVAAREAFDRAEEEFTAAGARWRLERMQRARRELGVG